jgi:hypothetical protein
VFVSRVFHGWSRWSRPRKTALILTVRTVRIKAVFRFKFFREHSKKAYHPTISAMETARTPVHRAILRPATTNMPAKILPGAHKPRPAAQPTVDEILNKTARGEQVSEEIRSQQAETSFLRRSRWLARTGVIGQTAHAHPRLRAAIVPRGVCPGKPCTQGGGC